MAFELDAKDRAILYHLDRDARQPISKLSKKVKLNREVARYRIEQMTKAGVIQKFLTFIALPERGYVATTFFFRFQDTSAKSEESIIRYLTEKKSVIWLASMDGRFNLGFTLCTQSISEVAKFIDEFRDPFRPFISDFQMANVVMAWRFPRKYLVGEASESGIQILNAKLARADIDDTDKAILARLGDDGRMTAVEIAKKTGVSADSVANRINKMKKDGLIAGIGILLDSVVINRRLYRSFVSFHNILSVEQKFLKYCREHPNAVQVKRMLGPWEYEVDLEVQDETELRKIHSEFKEHFKDAVRATSFANVYKTHKFNLTGFLV